MQCLNCVRVSMLFLTLTTYEKVFYQNKLSTSAVLVALSSIHDTAWQKRPLLKLSKVINRHCSYSINKMFKDWKLHIYLGNQTSQIRTHFDGLSPQGDIKDLHSCRDLSKPTPLPQIFIYRWIIFTVEVHWRKIQVCKCSISVTGDEIYLYWGKNPKHKKMPPQSFHVSPFKHPRKE